MRYIFHPEALQEYGDAATYYDKISPELGNAFIESVENGINRIISRPEAWQIEEEDVRRHLIKRFPFGIFYTIERDHILIIAVMHMSRRPGYWKNRLESR